MTSRLGRPVLRFMEAVKAGQPRRQKRYATSAVECYWVFCKETFIIQDKATSCLLLNDGVGNVFPSGGIGTGMLLELPVAMLDTESVQLVESEEFKAATVRTCLAGMLDGAYQYRGGSWGLG